jgi:hypothetical protein
MPTTEQAIWDAYAAAVGNEFNVLLTSLAVKANPDENPTQQPTDEELLEKHRNGLVLIAKTRDMLLSIIPKETK